MQQKTQISTPETNRIICSQLLQDTDVAHGEAMEPASIPMQVPLSDQASVSTRDKVLTSLQHSPVMEDRLGDFIFGLKKMFTDLFNTLCCLNMNRHFLVRPLTP